MPTALDFRPAAAAPARWLVLLLCGLYLLAGFAGHDPWKSDDAVHLAIAHGFASGDDWLVPRLAGEPWPEFEPLYHWLAAFTGSLTNGVLAFHDGARLASVLFGALYFLFLGKGARTLFGAEAGLAAPLLAVGTLGLLVPLHDAQPAPAILAASAAVFWGLTLPAGRPIASSLLVGIGYGLAFLSGGLAALIPLAPLWLLLILRRQWLAALFAPLFAAALALGWLFLLDRSNPTFLSAWWDAEVVGLLPRGGFGRDHPELLAWFAWPAWPLALWALWACRRQATDLLLPLLGLILGVAWFLLHEARAGNALALLTPLLLLAAGGAGRLRRGAANALDWFGLLTFTLIAGLIWLGAAAMGLGWPPTVAHNFTKMEPGFSVDYSAWTVALAAAATAIWIGVLLRLPRSPWRGSIRWAAGVTTMWALLMTLWLPWINYGKSYRGVVASLEQALPDKHGCIARENLGAVQRASLDYFAGIRTRPQSKSERCNWLLVQSGPQDAVPSGWGRVWEGQRPGDKSERLRLYRKN